MQEISRPATDLLSSQEWFCSLELVICDKQCQVSYWRSFAFLNVNESPINPLNLELNPICYLLALLGAQNFLHVSRIRVKSLTLKLLMSYIYGAHILDVSRSHTTTQHSR